MSTTVLVTDYAWPSLEIERAILGGHDAGLLVAETGSEAELVALAPRADAILTNWARVPEAALEAASRCWSSPVTASASTTSREPSMRPLSVGWTRWSKNDWRSRSGW